MKQKIFFILKEIICKVLITGKNLVGTKPPIVSILGYHSISSDKTIIDVTLKDFKSQLEHLKTTFQFITLDEVMNHLQGKIVITKPSVAFTFDDGYNDLLKTVAPLLKKNNIPATLFMVSHPENVNRNELRNNKKLLTLKEVKKLQRSGWIIGSHTITHANLLNIDKGNLEYEINYSKKTLEKYLKTPVKYFAYPKGFYNKRVVQMVRKCGYKAAFTMDEKIINGNTNLFMIPRLGVDRTRTRTQFISMFTHSAIKYFLLKKFVYNTTSSVVHDTKQVITFLASQIFLKKKSIKIYE